MAGDRPAGGSMLQRDQPARIGIVLYDGVEPIDLGGTLGVISMASRLLPGLSATTIAEHAGPVRCAGGLTVLAAHGFSDLAGWAPPEGSPETRLGTPPGDAAFDAVVVTGGPGWAAQSRNPAMLAFLRGLDPARLGLHRRADPGRGRLAQWVPRDHAANRDRRGDRGTARAAGRDGRRRDGGADRRRRRPGHRRRGEPGARPDAAPDRPAVRRGGTRRGGAADRVRPRLRRQPGGAGDRHRRRSSSIDLTATPAPAPTPTGPPPTGPPPTGQK